MDYKLLTNEQLKKLREQIVIQQEALNLLDEKLIEEQGIRVGKDWSKKFQNLFFNN